MIKKLKLFLITLVSAGTFLVPVAATATVMAVGDPESPTSNTQEGLCEGINLNTSSDDCVENDPDSENKINQVLKLVVNIFSLVVGVVAVIMIVVGGLKYITSGGDSSNVTGAKNTILYAVIGLVVVALAQFIVRYVLSKVTATPDV